MSDLSRMKELIGILNEASKTYYSEGKEIMPNKEYDELYDELLALEKNEGVVLEDSPTKRVGYEVVSFLPKKEHESPMLSLDKTKEIDALASFLSNKEGILSWKLDGLTIVVTYENGQLIEALTRGNGVVGEVVTANARTFLNLPKRIAYQGKLVLRGEAVIKYSDFERLNEEIIDENMKYKNPRNLCAGSVRQLNSEVTANRCVNFYAFSLVDFEKNHENEALERSRVAQLTWMEQLGFSVVEYKVVNAITIYQAKDYFEEHIRAIDIPSDGLVLTYEDILYADRLGSTAKFPRHSLAFKWKDEEAQTILRKIEWSPSRTGLINPVAIFDSVELEGTTVSRASVHNLSIMEELELGIGDKILVYKANMIIPQISNNLTRSGNLQIPSSCPVCKMETRIKQEYDVKVLTCENPQCPAKQIKKFELFVSRNAMNIDGISEATLQVLIEKGFIREYADLFEIQNHKDEIISLKGFGKRSYENMIESIENAKDTTLERVLYAIGIPGIGVSNAKVISKSFQYDFDKIQEAAILNQVERFLAIEGIGDILAEAIVHYFKNEENRAILTRLLAHITIERPQSAGAVKETFIQDKTFVITGSVERFKNRDELKRFIEQHGGKATGSVSAKTDYLINNDALSNSSKNKKARELGIPVLTEDVFMQMLEK